MSEEKQETSITYEKLFEILRLEKTREDLQKLEESFFDNVATYIKEKMQILNSSDQTNIYGEEQQQNTRTQLGNIKKILKEVYERREKKIVLMSLTKSRTKGSIMDTSAFLDEEKQLFEEVGGVLSTYKKGILHNVIEANKVELKKEREKQETEESPEKMLDENSKLQVVRFLQKVDKFIGMDLEEYGPFNKEDVANLPQDVVGVLLNNNSAEVFYK
jgi:DNA replication factor GINS